MKTYIYVGGPTINGFTSRDGTQILLHKNKTYRLDENDVYIKTMLAKKDANGMPAPWLVEVEGVVTEAKKDSEPIDPKTDLKKGKS